MKKAMMLFLSAMTMIIAMSNARAAMQKLTVTRLGDFVDNMLSLGAGAECGAPESKVHLAMRFC